MVDLALLPQFSFLAMTVMIAGHQLDSILQLRVLIVVIGL
jgi:hypothetical protein